MPPPRAIVTSILTVVLILTLYNLYFYSASYTALSPETPRNYESLSSLQFSLSQVPNARIPTLRVHLRNSSPKPFTVLTWGTPLDPTALAQHVFRITDADTLDVVRGPPAVAVSRPQPPPKADFIEIPARGDITRDVPLAEKWIPRKKLRIAAAGRWHAVWERTMKEIPRVELEKLTNAMRDEFHVRDAEFDFREAHEHVVGEAEPKKGSTGQGIPGLVEGGRGSPGGGAPGGEKGAAVPLDA